jgi:ATP-dependent protease ClpP protease subunit
MKDLRYIKNISDTNGEATILLYDSIGTHIDENGIVNGIDGNHFAKEIEYLQTVASKINVRINSVGGNVLDGYSIISAILNSKVPVDIYVDGLAASIAGVIAMTGSKKYMMDYGTIMLHNPSGSNDQPLLDLIKNTLVTILSNNTLLSQEDISKIMDDETYFTSTEAINMGLVDEVITSNKKIKVNRHSLIDMAKIYNKIINPVKMIKIKNVLGLEEAVAEEVIVDSIEKLQAENKTLSETLEAEKLAKEELQNKINTIELEKEEAKKAEIKEMVNSFVTSGKIKEEESESMIKLASVDFDGVKNMLEKIGSKVAVKIFDTAKVAVTNGASDRSDWTIREWEKKDSKGLAKIKNETPEVYNRMFNEFYKK